MEGVGQFVGEGATRGLIDEGLDGGDESAVAGKPNRILGPQACVVEASGFAEGIVAAAMGIAGEVIQKLELAKDGEVGGGTESAFEFGQGCDFVAGRGCAGCLWGAGRGCHNILCTPGEVF